MHTDLLKACSLDALIPESLACWRELVADALAFFLQQLPVRRQQWLIEQQLMLSMQGTTAAAHLVALMQACPSLHKLGQIVARQPQLDEGLRRELQTLESLPARGTLEQLRVQVCAELRTHGFAINGLEMNQPPLAEGSVALVVPFVHHHQGERIEGVFKLLKPGVAKRLTEELDLLPGLARYLQERSVALSLPPVDYSELFDSVSRLLRQELDLQAEQGHLASAARLYADYPGLRVPRLLPWCTPQLTAMERIHGVKLTQAELPAAQRLQLARRLIEGLLGRPFWGRGEVALLHADLHGGNIWLDDQGCLVVLDWGLVVPLSKAQRVALMRLVLAAMSLDAARLTHGLETLGQGAAADPRLQAVVHDALRALVQQAQLPGFAWLQSLFDSLARAGYRLPDEFVLLKKTWLALSGVVHGLSDGQVEADQVLIPQLLQQFAQEWPLRGWVGASDHGFASHLSTLDLWQLASNAWLMPLRWGQQWLVQHEPGWRCSAQ